MKDSGVGVLPFMVLMASCGVYDDTAAEGRQVSVSRGARVIRAACLCEGKFGSRSEAGDKQGNGQVSSQWSSRVSSKTSAAFGAAISAAAEELVLRAEALPPTSAAPGTDYMYIS